jgi:outer membrane protein
VANSIDLNALIDEARQRHPRVSAARARLAEARARVEAVAAERWGNLGLNASTGRTRSSSESDARGSSSIGLQWTLPLFDRGAQNSRRGDAVGQVMVREVDVGDALKQVELQVWQQGQTLIGEREGLRYSRAVLVSADASLRVATERYRRGVGSFNDVLLPQNVAANARFQWVEAQANLRRAQLRLAASVGRFGPLLLR